MSRRTCRVACLLLVAVLVGPMHPLGAQAACHADTGACVDVEGDSESSIELEQDVTGGDANAGSQNIGVGGVDGNLRITAENRSRFATARGGDAESSMDVRGSSSTSVESAGSSVTVIAEAEGTGGVTQTAGPGSSAATQQSSQEPPPLVPATGGSIFSSTAVSQSSTASTFPQAVAIAAPAKPLPATLLQEGHSKVVLRSSGTARSGDALAGGQIIGVVAVTGETVIRATNRSLFAAARSGDARANLKLAAAAGATLRLPPSMLSVGATSRGQAGIGQTATPDAVVVVLDDVGVVDVVADADVAQEATLTSAPLSMAVAGQGTAGGGVAPRLWLARQGDETTRLNVRSELTGGDAVAGGQIIGLSGVSGDALVDASNSSRFATARGGDAAAGARLRVASGPRVDLAPAATEARATAEGLAAVAQEASPTLRLAASSSSPDAGEERGSLLAVERANLARLMGSASVQQTASTTVSPVAFASAR